jgi:hypothetical protein
MGYRWIANRLAEHAPMLGSVSSRPVLLLNVVHVLLILSALLDP